MTTQEAIETAFVDVPYPGDNNITVHRCPECDDIAKHFCGTTWRDHTLPELLQYKDSIPFFTSAALQYFLPAYMIVSLGKWQEADLIPFSILYVWLPKGSAEEKRMQDYRRERQGIFTQPQRAAIVAYLRDWEVSENPNPDSEDIAVATKLLLDK